MSNSPGVMTRRERGIAALSKPQQARLVLESTVAVVCAVLAVWLLLWILFHIPGSVASGILRPSGSYSPVLAFQREDALRLGRSVTGKASPEIAYANLEASINGVLAEKGKGPVVLYLSVPGVSAGQGAYVLPTEETAFLQADPNASPLVNVTTVIKRFVESPSTRKLLILDAGQIGTDGNLGVFGNAFVARLRSMIAAEKPKGMAVLCATAPGQVSWVSEADGRSVFGHYVAEGLAGKAEAWDASGQVTVKGLAAYVRHHVERWARTNRQAAQTPILIGDTDLNFPLKRTAQAARTNREPIEEKVAKQLNTAWASRDQLEVSVPYRYTPVAWRAYLETLLRAERLARAGRNDECKAALESLGALKLTISKRSRGWPVDRAWSLGLAQRLGDPAKREISAAASDAIDQARDLLTDSNRREAARKKSAAPTSPGLAPEKPKSAASKDDASKKSEEPKQVVMATTEDVRDTKPVLPELNDVMDPSSKGIPRYVEAQLLPWVVSFAKRSPTTDFEGNRGALLNAALAARRLSETALAADERALRWIEPLLAAGDEARRHAQDLMFSNSPEALDEALAKLQNATRHYERALKVAKTVAEASDLADQIAVELPYLGRWSASRGKGLDVTIDTVLKQTLALVDALSNGTPITAPSQWEAEWKALDDHHARARSAFDDLVTEFRSQCDLARSGGSSRWREIDDLLSVPIIPAELRAALLTRSAEISRSSRLSETTDDPAPELDGNRRGSSRSSSSDDRENESPLDPVCQLLALGEARLELGLLELGGADKTDLDKLRLAYEACLAVPKELGESTLEPFVQFGDLDRIARSHLLERTRQQSTRPPTFSQDGYYSPELIAADRASRILPPSFARLLPEENGPDRQRARFQRQAQLLCLGRRLSDDFAPEHATLVLDAARTAMDSPALQNARETTQRRATEARLAFRSDSTSPIPLNDKDVPLNLRVATEGDVPAGDAVLILGLDPTKAVAAKEIAAKPAPTVRVPAPNEQLRDYMLSRTEYSSESQTVDFRPWVFYRGHVFDLQRQISVALKPIEEAITVTVQDKDAPALGWVDQFNEHPGRGYSHFGAVLRYKLVLQNNLDKPLRAHVTYGLDGQPTQTRLITFKPKQKDESITGPVLATVDLIDGKTRTLSVSVHEGSENGKKLSVDRNYPFRMLKPEEYMTASVLFDPATGVFSLWVTHLRNDLVTGPVKVFATIASVPGQSKPLPRGGYCYGWVQFLPPYPEKITWSVQVGLKPNAFGGTVPTGAPPAKPPEGQGATTPPPPKQ
jgi:hypothetical protein